jgi:hypothetical protein
MTPWAGLGRRGAIAAFGVSVCLGFVAIGWAARADSCRDALGTKQPLLATSDPLHRLAMRVWQRLDGPFVAATGRKTELVLLGENARTAAGQPFQRLAMACGRPERGPAIVVTWPFLDSLRRGDAYDEDFLALILGHELGHRYHDFDANGRFKGSADEARADQRGAFLAASVGYATHRMVCEDRIDAYLDAEGVREGSREARKAALPDVLRRFEAWDAVHALATGMVFLAPAAALEVLEVTRHELARMGESLPEMQFLEVVSLLQQGAEGSCWQSVVGFEDMPNDHLRCIPIFASHTSLRPRGIGGDKAFGTRGKCDAATPANIALRRALTILAGLDPELIGRVAHHSASACAHLYLGETDLAAGFADRVEAALADGAAATPAEVRAAVKANRALLAWLQWAATPAGQLAPGADGTAFAAWKKALGAARKGFAGHPELEAWLDTISGRKAARRQSGKTMALPRCTSPRVRPNEPVSWAPIVLPPLPEAAPAGGCPCGWVEHLAWRDPDAVKPEHGTLRLCRPAVDEGAGLAQMLEMQLPLRGVGGRAHLLVPGAGPLADVQTWRTQCDALVLAGVSDRGTLVFNGDCPALGASQVVIESEGCQVRRVVRYAAVGG